MIIRRVKTKNFVQLENALVRDQNLTLDEHGMLHYLLSLPDDWEVSRHNCAKFWGIGRDKAARIFRSLRKRGWAQVERVHGDDGTFLGVRWIITDEPGEPIDDAALDAEEAADDEADPVPSHVAEETSARDAVEQSADEAVAAPATAHHDTPLPCDGLPVTRVNRDTGKAYHGYIDSKKTESYENRDSQTPPNANPQTSCADPPTKTGGCAFSDLLRVWPPDVVLSRVAAEKAWQHLSTTDRRRANDCAQSYLDDCARQSRKVCDLTTYLREKRFERFADSVRAGVVAVEIKPYTPQWYRWRDYKKAHGQPVSFMESRAAQGEKWFERSEWPPPVDRDSLSDGLGQITLAGGGGT